MINNKDFAIKHAGQQVKYSSSLLNSFVGCLGTIAGYCHKDQESILIMPSPEFIKYKGLVYFDRIVLYLDKFTPTVAYNNSTIGFTVSIQFISVIEKIKNTKYPHVCNICNAPALIMFNIIDCSNSICKNKY